jgi:hypothetical protein
MDLAQLMLLAKTTTSKAHGKMATHLTATLTTNHATLLSPTSRSKNCDTKKRTPFAGVLFFVLN